MCCVLRYGMAENQKNFLEKYRYFVIKNPTLASEIEVALKWASYFVAGRFSQSPVVTELIHSASRLLNLLNDSILRKAVGIPVNVDVAVERLQTFLTIIEYSEVFTEIAARQLKGPRAKWLIVVLIHLSKFVIRLILLFKHEQGLQCFPPIPPLNRTKEIPGINKDNEKAIENGGPNVEVTFSLKTSGRVMRTLDAAPPLVSRSWKLPKVDETNCKSVSRKETKLYGKNFTAEMLHMCRPLIHLASIGAFGEFSWKPWLIALGLDATSIHLLKQNDDFNMWEKREINRRAFSMMLYLLRSPFYDHYSKMRIINFMKGITERVPGSGLFLRPLIEYIPEWQQLYFYVWSS